MNLQDYGLEEIEDLEDAAPAQRTEPPRTRAKRRHPLRAALSAFGYLLLALVLVYLAVAIYLRVDARLGTDPSEEELEEDPLLYTQSDLDALLESAEEEAQARILEAYANGGTDERAAILDYIRNGIEADMGSIGVLRPLYPDYLIASTDGAYHFVPIDPSLRKTEISAENYQLLDSGELQYLSDGVVVSHKGIDVSSYQGKINWERVAADGVEFAFLRAGYRGYGSEGKLVEDDTFGYNFEHAFANGIHVGAYFFSQARTVEEAREEANLVLEQLEPYRDIARGIPIVIDVERDGTKYRTEGLTNTERTDVIVAFCQAVEEAGYRPAIYFNTEMPAFYLELDRLEGYRKWYAFFSTETAFYPYYYEILQYSDKGRVDGISGAVDLDFSLTAFWEE